MANTTTPQLPAVISLNGDEQIAAVSVSTQGVIGPMVRVTTGQIASLVPAGPAGPPGPGGTTDINSPDGSLVVAGSGTAVIDLTAGTVAGGENVLPGVYLFASLPSPALYPNHYASTSDQGAVYSTGTAWQILYNVTGATLQISTGTPLPPGTNGTAYSQQLTATLGTPPYTWSSVVQYAASGTANTFTLSGTGVLASADPTNNSTTAIVVQVQDATGAVAPQKTLTVQINASLTPAATPTFSPAAGTYHVAQTVAISCSTSASTIYYTTNGSTPTTSSAVYSGPITVSSSQTVQAIATASGFTQSAVGSAAYVISLTSPLGANPNAVEYYNNEQPFLNIVKNAGGWSTRTAGSNGETHEEWALQLDSDGYPTSLTLSPLPPGGQRMGQLLLLLMNGQTTPAGAATPYPIGPYTFTFQGNGSILFTGDFGNINTSSLTPSAYLTVSGSQKIVSTLPPGVTGSCQVALATPSATGAQIIIESTDALAAGNYLKAFSCIESTLVGNTSPFHPNFLASIQNYSSIRYKDWQHTDTEWVPYGVIGGSIASGSTSAIMIVPGQSAYTITGISKATSALVTINSSAASNPLFIGETLIFSGVVGMTQINNTWGYVTGLGGSSGAYTATVNINSSGYTAYSSGGSAYPGATWEYATQTRNVYFTDGEIKAASFTGGSPEITWTGGLTNTITSTYVNADWFCQFVILWNDNFAIRPQPSNMSWATNQGVPLEICVALSNTISANCGTSFSPGVTDADVTSIANLVMSGTGMQSGYSALNSTLNWFNEWGNEAWNGSYINFYIAGSLGAAYWPSQTPGGSNSQWSANYRGARTAIIAELIQTAIGSGPMARVFPMLNCQAADFSNTVWTTPYWTAPIDGYTGPATAHPVKWVGIAPYMGNGLGSSSSGGSPSWADATTIVGQSDGGLSYFFQCFTSNVMTGGSSPGTLSSIPSGGWLAQTLGWIQAYVTGLVSYPTLSLVGYEGGTQFSCNNAQSSNPTLYTKWLALMIAAESDSRMNTVYTAWLNNWATTAGATAVNILHPLQSCDPCTEYGDEGILQSTMQTISPLSAAPPKYQAVQNYIG